MRSIGLYDFLKARMIEINNVFLFCLKIFDCFGQFREYNANVETIKCLIKYPESQTMYNDKKLNELKNSTKLFYEKFTVLFGCDEIITTNTLADEFIEEFNDFIEGKCEIQAEKYKTYDGKYGYFVPRETGIDDTGKEDDFIKNAVGGFSNSKIPYDIGFFYG